MTRKPDVKFTLRLPEELHERLSQSAAAAVPARSLNSEIIARLEMSRELEEKARQASKRVLEVAEMLQREVEAQKQAGRTTYQLEHMFHTLEGIADHLERPLPAPVQDLSIFQVTNEIMDQAGRNLGETLAELINRVSDLEDRLSLKRNKGADGKKGAQ